jgi:hypothetical protein
MIYEVRRQNFCGIASLCDTFHVPKLLSQQLLQFGRSVDGLGELSVRRGRSARRWRTVHGLRVLRVFVVFLRAFAFDPDLF